MSSLGQDSLAFKEWVKTSGYVEADDISDFRGTVIGIDAEDFLNTLLSHPNTREPLLPALGGLPFALTQHVDVELERLREAGITPIFWFPGLDIAPRDRKTVSRESQRAVKIIEEAWNVYDQGKGDQAVTNFGKTCTYRSQHILRYLFFYLHGKGVDVKQAPYNAAAQLVYMEQKDYVNAVCGSVNLIVFGADRVILNFDWENKLVIFIDVEDFLAKLQLSHHHLVDLLLVSGCSILAPLPEIDTDATATELKINLARRVLARYGNDGHTACSQASDKEYLAIYQKARVAITHMVIIHENGEIKQLESEKSPNDVHEVISQRLPDELLTYHQHGLIGPRVLNWRVRQEIFETAPLDGGMSTTYRDLVESGLKSLRARSITVLSRNLHRYFHKQDVELLCWFNEGKKQSLDIPSVTWETFLRDTEGWHVRDNLLSQCEAVSDIEIESTPIQFAITLLADDSFAKKTVTRRKDGEHSILRSRKELLANITWRFLQDRGYINGDHTLSAWGRALRASFDKAQQDQYLGQTDPAEEAEEAIFMAFELLRLNVLNNKSLFPTPPYSGPPMRGDEQDKANTLLVSRIASLGTFKHAKIGYTGPLSRHLLAYHQVAAAVRNSMRDLVEMHAVNLLLGGSVVRLRDKADFQDTGKNMPFLKEPDLGLALVVKSHLDELSNSPERRADIRKWFNHARDIDGDLQKAWKMWDAVNAGIQAADSAIVNSEIRDMFQDADSWLLAKRMAGTSTNSPKVNGTNGTS